MSLWSRSQPTRPRRRFSDDLTARIAEFGQIDDDDDDVSDRPATKAPAAAAVPEKPVAVEKPAPKPKAPTKAKVGLLYWQMRIKWR